MNVNHWWISALGLALAVGAAILIGPAFAPPAPASAMPILGFSAGAVVVGVAFALGRSQFMGGQPAHQLYDFRPLAAIFAVGLALRIALLASEPILEVDFNRYLWDGALAAHGFNPFSVAPADVARLAYDDLRLELSKAAGAIFERISYPELKTIYPPVAQAAFAAAYLISPWSLTAWRGVCIAADSVTFALIVALLMACGRPPLWAVLYWWNPLVLKEVVNSAHMEAILLPLVLGSILLTVRARYSAAALVLGLAIGTKLWPVMLAPLILRPLLDRPARLATSMAIGTVIVGACVLPIWLGGLDTSSGFVGFATHWTTNSALFPAFERLLAVVVGATEPSSGFMSGQIARLACAVLAAAVAVRLAWRPVTSPADMVGRAYGIVTALLLLSPAQFPWYVLWVLPLATIHPRAGWHVAAALMPAYYAAFHFRLAGTYAIYETYVVWALWMPIWLALAVDARCRPSRSR